jgi:hypothetical protein
VSCNLTVGQGAFLHSFTMNNPWDNNNSISNRPNDILSLANKHNLYPTIHNNKSSNSYSATCTQLLNSILQLFNAQLKQHDTEHKQEQINRDQSNQLVEGLLSYLTSLNSNNLSSILLNNSMGANKLPLCAPLAQQRLLSLLTQLFQLDKVNHSALQVLMNELDKNVHLNALSSCCSSLLVSSNQFEESYYLAQLFLSQLVNVK